jgi:hypothetical protein
MQEMPKLDAWLQVQTKWPLAYLMKFARSLVELRDFFVSLAVAPFGLLQLRQQSVPLFSECAQLILCRSAQRKAFMSLQVPR